MNEAVKKFRRSAIHSVSVGIAAFYLLLLIVLQLMPFWLQFVQSVQPMSYIFYPGQIDFWPQSFNFGNYITAWKDSNMIYGFINSTIITGLFVVISLFVAILVGYVLAKKRFHGKKFIFIFLLSSMMVPGEINMLINYRLLGNLYLLNTRFAVIAPGLVNVFGVFLAKQFIESIPDSLLEAMNIDGAGELRKLWHIIIPLSKPMIATYVILTAIGSWNEYLWPSLVLTGDDNMLTVQLLLMSFTIGTGDTYEKVMRSAALISTVVPIVIVYLIFQRQFIEGISITGLK